MSAKKTRCPFCHAPALSLVALWGHIRAKHAQQAEAIKSAQDSLVAATLGGAW